MSRSAAIVLLATLAPLAGGGVFAQDRAESGLRASYADLADLADAAPLVARVRIEDQAALKPERAPNVQPGQARLYIEAETISLLSGGAPLGQSVRYLVDVPLDARGKVPKLKKGEFVVFARGVPGRPGEIQLVGPHAQLPWTQDLETRLRPILAALVDPGAPPRITGVRDALAVDGNLVGESETQVFLATEGGAPVSLSIVRRPGMAPAWGVSWSEIVDQAASPPTRDTLEWYRLACFLPAQLPASANLARDGEARARAAADYRFVIDRLGTCPRYLSGA